MKVVAALGGGVVKLVDIPMPALNDYECLVRIDACGLCSSTDIKLSKNESADLHVNFPTILGHEGVGTVIELGDKARYIKLGERYVGPMTRVPPDCGYYSNWAHMAEYGFVRDTRAMVEDGLLDARELEGQIDRSLKLITDDISAPDAAMLLTIKENYSALINFGLAPGMKVLIMGDGAVALGLCKMARIMGAAWVGCAGHHDDRLERIRAQGGVDLAVNTLTDSLEGALGGHKCEIAVDAAGSLDAVKQAARCVTPGGKVGMYGVIPRQRAQFNLFDIPNNICLHTLNWPYREHRTHDAVMDLIREGKLNPADYYSHVLPIDDAERGFEMIRKREAYKVIFVMHQT